MFSDKIPITRSTENVAVLGGGPQSRVVDKIPLSGYATDAARLREPNRRGVRRLAAFLSDAREGPTMSSAAIPFRPEIATAIASSLARTSRPVFGEYRAAVPYRRLVQQMEASEYVRPSIDEALRELSSRGNIRWKWEVVNTLWGSEEDEPATEETRLLYVEADASLWQWLPGEHRETVAPAKKAPRVGVLSEEWVEARVEEALIACHGYEDGEVSNYDAELNSSRLAREISSERGASFSTAKSAVSKTLRTMFPSRDRSRKDGLATYRVYREMRTPLMRWFRERVDGISKAYGTVGEIGDLAEQELHHRVARDS